MFIWIFLLDSKALASFYISLHSRSRFIANFPLPIMLRHFNNERVVADLGKFLVYLDYYASNLTNYSFYNVLSSEISKYRDDTTAKFAKRNT